MIKSWNHNVDDMRLDLNEIDLKILTSIKGNGPKLTKLILDYRKDIKNFEDI